MLFRAELACELADGMCTELACGGQATQAIFDRNVGTGQLTYVPTRCSSAPPATELAYGGASPHAPDRLDGDRLLHHRCPTNSLCMPVSLSVTCVSVSVKSPLRVWVLCHAWL